MKMKFSVFMLATVLLCAIATVAQAVYTGILPYDNTPFPVQNVKSICPLAEAASCVTITKTKGLLATFPTTDSNGKFYLMLYWTASDNSGNPLIVKRVLNSNTAWQPGSSGDLTINHGISGASFYAYSSASKTYNICVDMQ
jgi:hypothetical protein